MVICGADNCIHRLNSWLQEEYVSCLRVSSYELSQQQLPVSWLSLQSRDEPSSHLMFFCVGNNHKQPNFCRCLQCYSTYKLLGHVRSIPINRNLTSWQSPDLSVRLWCVVLRSMWELMLVGKGMGIISIRRMCQKLSFDDLAVIVMAQHGVQ